VTIIHIATNPLGGAGRSACRLHEGLLKLGVDSRMLTARPANGIQGASELIVSKQLPLRARRWFRRKIHAWRGRNITRAPQPAFEQFSLDSSPVAHELAREIPQDAIIHLHWVAGFVDYRTFFQDVSGRAIVWTMHDMNPFTGGCHFDNGCGRFVNDCGRCPQLGSQQEIDLSRKIWTRKKQALDRFGPHGLQIVSPSRWMAEEVSRSSLLDGRSCRIIPYGLDTDIFRPIDKVASRKQLGLPIDGRIILFGAASLENPRKGYDQFIQSLEHLTPDDSVFLLSMGTEPPQISSRFPSRHMGSVKGDQMLATIYNAADLFVISSLADNLPNTVLESLSCGTPVVGYASGGTPDLVEPMETGLLVETGDTVGLARSMQQMLLNDALREHCSHVGRTRILANHTLEIQARQYLEVYAEKHAHRS